MGRRTAVRRTVAATDIPAVARGSLDIPLERSVQDPLREAGWSSPLVVFGWAVDPAGIDRIEVLLDGRVVAEAEQGLPREDVASLRAEYRRIGAAADAGWLAVIPFEDIAAGEHTLSAIIHGCSGTLTLDPKPVWLRKESVRADPRRQRRLAALLRCPRCGGALDGDADGLRCSACATPIPVNEFGTLLVDDTYAGLDWRQAVATSHSYPAAAARVVRDLAAGLVLDIGAGLRENLPNVVQLDAIAFPTTDVAANAAALPFADESFDGVVACNLLEHVSDPAAVVAEMRRVCKGGGRIYADFASVHPYHGFPHHYFNATDTGLAWLMRDVGGARGDVEAVEGLNTVRLVLETWLGSLDDIAASQRARQLSVADLLALLYLHRDDLAAIAPLSTTYPGGHRLIPLKVIFDGVRER